jgi:3-dehydroquinate synthase
VQRLRVRTKAQTDEYEIKIGRNVLCTVGEEARRWLGKEARKIAVISNPRVLGHYGSPAIRSLRANGFAVSQKLIGDGERFKSFRTVEDILAFLSQGRLERSDAILALGGGVIGDLAGFAAAIYLRGISFVYVPTTLLAQIDSSVGGKTGVNLVTGKNLAGAFHQPAGVVTDVETLRTLDSREVVAGCCESVKQGAVGSRRLFNQTVRFLRALDSSRDALESSQLEELIAAQCAFKASIVSKDQREARERRDHQSRRILNFGHTTGHAIEAITRYRLFRHGEAVGVGMLVAGELSKNLGLLSVPELESLTDGVRLCGPLPRTDNLNQDAILTSILHDKKSVAGSIQWVLLERIGRARIVSGKEIAPRLLKHSLRDALRKASTLRN